MNDIKYYKEIQHTIQISHTYSDISYIFRYLIHIQISVCMYVINIYLVSAPLRAFSGALMNGSHLYSDILCILRYLMYIQRSHTYSDISCILQLLTCFRLLLQLNDWLKLKIERWY